MKPLSTSHVVVFGLAKSGVAAARLLLARGARVTVLDARGRAELGAVADALAGAGAALQLGGPTPPGLLERADLVVVSPGVPLALPELAAARAAGVPVWGEVELAAREVPFVPLVGITGTNGKSTTTALTGELFARAGLKTFVGGNLGRPLSEAALQEPPGGGAWEALVVELSSFQLEGISLLRPRAAALLNVTPDHLDRYASHQDYGLAKQRLFLTQGKGDAAVVNADDPFALELVQGAVRRTGAALWGFTLDAGARVEGAAGLAVGEEGGFGLRGGPLDGERYRVAARSLRGAHNLQNAMAAALLARLSGVPRDAVQAGLDGYPGLAHRLESVRVLDGVEWVNDSKATNVDSVLVALRAFPGRLWLIAGGKGKGAPYAPMVEAGRGKVRGVLTIGHDAPALAAAYGAEAGVEVHPCGTLAAAVERARGLARPGDVVLLSPACASYDQFQNFEDRGDQFKRLVRGLA